MINIYIVINSILFVSLAISAAGFTKKSLSARYGLAVDKILEKREYTRLWTASWIHAHWTHLLINALMLLAMSTGIDWPLSALDFIFLFVMSQLGGNLLALFTYRSDRSGQHDAVGVAGGVSGVLLASLALYPSLTVAVPSLSSLPVWPLAVVFLVVSVFALKPHSSTMIHDAHLGGAVVGLLLTPLVAPEMLQNTLWIAVGILVPTVVLFYTFVKAPENLVPKTLHFLSNPRNPWNVVEQTSMTAHHALDYATPEEELNALLDKINREGYQNLSDYERERLRSISAGQRVKA